MINEMTLDQKKVHDCIVDFADSGESLLTFGGYAGVGKTFTLAKVGHTLKENGLNLAFCTLSGKASSILRKKLDGVLTEDDYCGTIHKLIYYLKEKFVKPSGKEQLVFEKNESTKTDFDLIILDEASMVNRRIFNDLQSLNIPILACGDHAQLPPIPDFRDGEDNFNLMADPEIRLEKIIRQAEDNAIIKISRMVREGENIPLGTWNDGQTIKTSDGSVVSRMYDFTDPDSTILCGFNKTRHRINRFARGKRGFDERFPMSGDFIICLMNDYMRDIYNGDIGWVEKIEDEYQDHFLLAVIIAGERHRLPVSREQFYANRTMSELRDEFGLYDYAYAITTHKFQGSENRRVLVYDEPVGKTDDDRRRWRYTAFTRAKERLIIIA